MTLTCNQILSLTEVCQIYYLVELLHSNGKLPEQFEFEALGHLAVGDDASL